MAKVRLVLPFNRFGRALVENESGETIGEVVRQPTGFHNAYDMDGNIVGMSWSAKRAAETLTHGVKICP